MPLREASPPPQRPFGAPSGPPPDGRRAMGESASDRPARGAASRRPELLCESIFGHGSAKDKW
eukprot:9542489-Alexandrium_andersonii.AAC.1